MDTKKIENQTIRSCIYSGTIQGVTAWTVYAVVECWFSSILPWIIKPGYVYKPSHWGFTVLLFALYPIFGLILGGLSGFCIRMVSGRITFLHNTKPTLIFSAMAISTVVSAFAINLVTQLQFNLIVLTLVLISALLIFGLVLSAGSGIWSRRIRFITNSWTIVILLLGMSWLTLDMFNSTIIMGMSALAYISAILLISFFVHKIFKSDLVGKSTSGVSAFSIINLFFLVIPVFVFIGITFFLKQAPYGNVSNLKPSTLKSDHPNVILITMDTVRADHLSLYGYDSDTTPNLRDFSKEAALYTRAIASGDMTLPTHASIFTGLYAICHGTHLDPWNGFSLGRPLSDKFDTIAEVLCEKGYSTMGVVANGGYLTHHFRMDQGFLYYDQRMSVPFFRSPQKFYLRRVVSNVISSFFPPDHKYLPRKAGEINKEIYTLLDKVKKDDTPFFFFINYMDAHWPYTPPPPFDTLYPGKGETFTSARRHTLVQEVMKLERKVTKEEHNHLISQYDGGIAYIDFHIEKLIAKLKKLNLYQNTLVIITSDHGENFGERDLFDHGVSVYQDQIHVPLIIKYPNEKKGCVVNKLVSSVDIMPTILDVLGYEVSENVQGRSLKSIESTKSREIVSESFPFGYMIDWHRRFDRIERAIFYGPYKFISSTDGKRELYDLKRDPREKEDLLAKVVHENPYTNMSYDNVAKVLDKKLKRWLLNSLLKPDSSAKIRLDKDALDRLKALGYIQ